MGRKPLNMTDEEKRIHTRQRKKEWESNNPDAIFQYRRKSVLQCCYRRASLPTRVTVLKYRFTDEELAPIYSRLLELDPSVSEGEMDPGSMSPPSPVSVIPHTMAPGVVV